MNSTEHGANTMTTATTSSTVDPMNSATVRACRVAYRAGGILGESWIQIEVHRAWRDRDGDLLFTQLSHVVYELSKYEGAHDIHQEMIDALADAVGSSTH